MKADIYSKAIKVEKRFIDQLNHVNNVVFLQWVQDIAGEHWLSKKLTSFDEDHFWVVIDHHIKYKGEAVENDILLVKTYVEHIGGVRSTRIVEFLKGEKLIVLAKTNWCLLNKQSRKPARIPTEIVKLFFQ